MLLLFYNYFTSEKTAGRMNSHLSLSSEDTLFFFKKTNHQTIKQTKNPQQITMFNQVLSIGK